MENVVTVGFILAAAAFFTKVFGLKGYWSFVAAAVVGLLAFEYPVFLATFPDLRPWLDPLAKLLAIVVSAAGAYDFTKEMATKAGGG